MKYELVNPGERAFVERGADLFGYSFINRRSLIFFYQIRALEKIVRDSFTIPAGKLGGFVTSPDCLSQEGACWIDQDSFVINSKISGDCEVLRSVVMDSAITDYTIVDNSTIRYSRLSNRVHISGSKLHSSSATDDTKIYFSWLTCCDVFGESVISYCGNVWGTDEDHLVIKNSYLCRFAEISGTSMIKNRSLVCPAFMTFFRKKRKKRKKALQSNGLRKL